MNHLLLILHCAFSVLSCIIVCQPKEVYRPKCSGYYYLCEVL